MTSNLFSRPLPRLLVVAGAVGIIGVTIDLVRGPPASAKSAATAYGASPAALPIDHSAVTYPIDGDALQPGAAVAAYDSSIDPAAVEAPAATTADLVDDDALEPGASVAAYDSP